MVTFPAGKIKGKKPPGCPAREGRSPLWSSRRRSPGGLPAQATPARRNGKKERGSPFASPCPPSSRPTGTGHRGTPGTAQASVPLPPAPAARPPKGTLSAAGGIGRNTLPRASSTPRAPPGRPSRTHSRNVRPPVACRIKQEEPGRGGHALSPSFLENCLDDLFEHVLPDAARPGKGDPSPPVHEVNGGHLRHPVGIGDREHLLPVPPVEENPEGVPLLLREPRDRCLESLPVQGNRRHVKIAAAVFCLD